MSKHGRYIIPQYVTHITSKSQNRLLQIEPSAKKAKHFCSKDN